MSAWKYNGASVVTGKLVPNSSICEKKKEDDPASQEIFERKEIAAAGTSAAIPYKKECQETYETFEQMQRKCQEEEAQKAEMSRKDGTWKNYYFPTVFPEKNEKRIRPKNVPIIVLNFLQRMLTVSGKEFSTCTTVGEFHDKFIEMFVPWFFANFQRDNEAKNYVYGIGSSPDLSHKQAYNRLQEWVKSVSKNFSGDPWKELHGFTAANIITPESVLYAMSDTSRSFEKGILKINGHTKNPGSKIAWIVSLDPYVSTRFVDPPLTPAQLFRLKKEMDDKY